MTTPPPPLTLVLGSEEVLCERAVSQVAAAARKLDATTERHEISGAESGAAGDIAQACSPSLFGGAAVVVIGQAESADDSCVKAIADAANNADEGVYVVVVHAGGAKGKKVVDAIKKLGAYVVQCAPIKGRALADFVSAELKGNKAKMDGQAQQTLLASVGSDPRELAAACAQLAHDVQGRPITSDDVQRYFGGAVEVTGFQISDAVMNKQAAEALRLLRLAEGTDGARLGPASVGALANGLRQVIAVSTASPGMSERGLAEEVRVPPWKVRMIQAQSRRWTQMDLARAVIVLADLDAAMKGGLREGDQLEPVQKGLELERAVFALAGK